MVDEITTSGEIRGCGAVAVLAIGYPLAWWLWTWAVLKVWGWYWVPLLGPPDAAAVLGALVGFTLTITYVRKPSDEPPKWNDWIIRYLVAPLYVVWMAWAAGKLTGAL